MFLYVYLRFFKSYVKHVFNLTSNKMFLLFLSFRLKSSCNNYDIFLSKLFHCKLLSTKKNVYYKSL